MDSLLVEKYFFWALASIPFVLATYGYFNLWRTWKSQKNIECSDPTNGEPFYTPLLFTLPTVLPGWYGVAAAYLVGAFIIGIGKGKCFFVQNAWYRTFIAMVALFAILMATWGNGEKGYLVIIGMALFMLIGHKIGKEAFRKNEEKANNK